MAGLKHYTVDLHITPTGKYEYTMSFKDQPAYPWVVKEALVQSPREAAEYLVRIAREKSNCWCAVGTPLLPEGRDKVSVEQLTLEGLAQETLEIVHINATQQVGFRPYEKGDHVNVAALCDDDAAEIIEMRLRDILSTNFLHLSGGSPVELRDDKYLLLVPFWPLRIKEC